MTPTNPDLGLFSPTMAFDEGARTLIVVLSLEQRRAVEVLAGIPADDSLAAEWGRLAKRQIAEMKDAMWHKHGQCVVKVYARMYDGYPV